MVNMNCLESSWNSWAGSPGEPANVSKSFFVFALPLNLCFRSRNPRCSCLFWFSYFRKFVIVSTEMLIDVVWGNSLLCEEFGVPKTNCKTAAFLNNPWHYPAPSCTCVSERAECSIPFFFLTFVYVFEWFALLMLLLDLSKLSDSGWVRIGWTGAGLKSKTGGLWARKTAKSEPDEKQLPFPASDECNIISDELACTECTLSMKF